MSPIQLARILEAVAVKIENSGHEILEPVASMLETSAKRAIGTYEFGWPPLAESTLSHKSGDTPLLETGELRDSIGHVVEANHGYVGTNDKKAAWQEFGTTKIPPRPFLGGALAHDGEKIPEIVRAAIEKMFT